MQGQSKAFASSARAELAFKAFILDMTADVEQSPEADLYRVQTLDEMFDRFAQHCARGVDEDGAIELTKYDFMDIASRMTAAGFEASVSQHRAGRWLQLSEQEAADYLRQNSRRIHQRAVGVGLCVACALPLMLAEALSSLFLGYAGWEVMSLLGVIGMLGMIAMGVYLLVTTRKPEKDDMVQSGRFFVDLRLAKQLQKLKRAVNEKGRRRKGKGVVMFIVSVAPILLGVMIDEVFFLNDAFTLVGVGGTLVMIAAGVYEMIMAKGEDKAIERLLERRE